MSSDLMLDFVNSSMMNKEAGHISIDQDGEWGKIHFPEISKTARAARDKPQLLYLLIVMCLYRLVKGYFMKLLVCTVVVFDLL